MFDNQYTRPKDTSSGAIGGSNVGLAALTQKVSEPEVHRELQMMEKALQNLHGEVDSLLDRLEFVRSPAPCGVGGETGSPPVVTPLGSRLYGFRDGVDAAARRLRSAREELGI